MGWIIMLATMYCIFTAAAGNKETVIIGATLGPVILVIIIVALVALVVGFMMYKSRTSKSENSIPYYN